MRILHLADVHLDRPFVGLPHEAARQRRAELLAALRRCLDAAREHAVDLVTIGGDLWEDENVTPDTRQSLAHELGRLEAPVLVVCGNHDPYLPGGNHQRTAWPPNVTVVGSSTLTEYEVGDGVSVWAASWTATPPDLSGLRGRRVGGAGRVAILLVHGTASDASFGDAGHCPFDPADARAAGFDLVLAGHLHAASDRDGVVYPGSPEPLDHTETGRHCYALVTITDDGVDTELVDVNRRRHREVRVDCADAASSAEVETRVRERVGDERDPDAILRVRLEGETAPDCAIDRARLEAKLADRFAAVTVIDATEPAVDAEEIARRQTADGLFVRALRERIAQAADERERRVLELALRAGVRALNGRKELLRVD
jgi:DNA repair exonuclease SbcCD nuclease subunit